MPTLTFGTGAGTGPAGSVAGNDGTGQVSITTGTGPVGNAVVASVDFDMTWNVAPGSVQFTPANINAAELGGGWNWVPSTSISATKFDIKAPNQALAPSTTYVWYYRVIK